MTEPNDHPMDKYIGGEGGWNEFKPDEQAMIGSAIQEAAALRPGWLTEEELEDIARFVRLAQRRKAAQGREGEVRHGQQR